MRIQKQSLNNLPKDYSGNKIWRDCQKVYSRAQLEYPEGLGIEKTLKMKRVMIGWRPLWQVSPDDFKKLIHRLRKEYVRIKEIERRNTEAYPG